MTDEILLILKHIATLGMGALKNAIINKAITNRVTKCDIINDVGKRIIDKELGYQLTEREYKIIRLYQRITDITMTALLNGDKFKNLLAQFKSDFKIDDITDKQRMYSIDTKGGKE